MTISGFGYRAAAAAFNGDFTTLLGGVTVYNYWQPDRLLVEDTTLRHTAGTGPVITLTGTRSGAPTAITVTCPTTGGALGVWQGLVTYGDGSTQAFTSAATVALTGKGAGLTLNIAAGTAVTSDVWKACAATLTDPMTGNSQGSTGATTSPIIMPGVNGRASVATDGTTFLRNNAVDLPAVPFTLIAIARRVTVPGVNGVMFGGDTGFFGCMRSLTTGVDMYNGAPGPANENAGLTANTWGLLIANFTGSTSDSFKFGSGAAVAGANSGSTNPVAGRSLGALTNGTSGTANEYLWGVWVGGGTPANIADIKTAVTSWYGAGIPL